MLYYLHYEKMSIRNIINMFFTLVYITILCKPYIIYVPNYEKHAPRISQVIATVARVSCKHGLWIVARINKKSQYRSIYNSVLAFYLLLFLPQSDCAGCHTAALLIHSRIMFPGRIDIFMAKNIRYEINIAGFLVKICTVGTAQFMRRNFL